MQDKPRAPDLLEAVADFLMKEVMPAVKGSDALTYKTLVSWNMLGVISREFREGESLAREEYARLGPLVSEQRSAPDNYPELLQRLEEMNTLLAARIRSEKLTDKDEEIWQSVKETLRAKLRISNPRFGTD